MVMRRIFLDRPSHAAAPATPATVAVNAVVVVDRCIRGETVHPEQMKTMKPLSWDDVEMVTMVAFRSFGSGLDRPPARARRNGGGGRVEVRIPGRGGLGPWREGL